MSVVDPAFRQEMVKYHREHPDEDMKPVPLLSTGVEAACAVAAFAMGYFCEEVCLSASALVGGTLMAAPLAAIALLSASVYTLSAFGVISETTADFTIGVGAAILTAAFVIAYIVFFPLNLLAILFIAFTGGFFAMMHIITSRMVDTHKKIRSAERQIARSEDDIVHIEDEHKVLLKGQIEQNRKLIETIETGLCQIRELQQLQMQTGEVVRHNYAQQLPAQEELLRKAYAERENLQEKLLRLTDHHEIV